MHELSVCRFLIKKAEEIAKGEGAKKVTLIGVQVGPLAGIDPDLLTEAFPGASQGSMAEGAKLRIHETSVQVRCSKCGAESEVKANYLICGLCGSQDTQLISGNELMMASLEFEEE